MAQGQLSSSSRTRVALFPLPITSVRGLTERIVACMFLCLIVVVSGCSQGAGHLSPATPTGTAVVVAAPTSLPTFSDWRTAYMGSDSRLHIISLDGKIDLTSDVLDGLTLNRLNIASAGFSPDGHLLAYVGEHGLVVMDVTGRVDTRHVTNVGGHEVVWSPDGSQLVLGDRDGVVCIAHISGGQCRVSAAQHNTQPTSIIGWVDGSHLAMQFLPPPPPGASQFIPRTGLGILDVTSWSFRVVATFAANDLGVPFFSLSPDGKQVLCWNKPFRNDPYTPMVQALDLATGRVTSLPHLAAAMGYSGFASLAWRPGTQTLAASTDSIDSNGNSDPKTWLLDVQHDTAVQLRLPEARFAGGWSPDGGHLILTTGWQFSVNLGPYEIDAATVAADGQVHSTVLTKAAFTFPYLGFVRTV